MKRYRITPDTNVRPSDDGPWVRWDDVQRLTEIAGENAVRLDLFHRTLVDIATVPLSLPDGQAAVRRAQDALGEARALLGGAAGRRSRENGSGGAP